MALMITQPKWFLEAKRGIGMLLVAIGTFIPMIASYFGVTIDAAMVGDLTAAVMSFLDAAALVVGYALWIWGTFYPTAPLSVLPPAK